MKQAHPAWRIGSGRAAAGTAAALALLLAGAVQGAAPEGGPAPERGARGAVMAAEPRPERATASVERLSLSVDEAVLMALEHNRALRVERVNPLISREGESIERAAFDPVLALRLAEGRERTAATGETVRTTAAEAGVTKRFASGAEAGVSLSAASESEEGREDEATVRAGVEVTQPLLRDAGRGTALAAVRQARIDSLLSEYELRGFAEALVADVELAYWEYVLARTQIAIYERSEALARQQLDEILQRVRVGSLAETEPAAAQAEAALRREALIRARSREALLKIRLLRLAFPAGLGGGTRELEPTSLPARPGDTTGPLAEHLAMADRLRPELNEARLRVARQELDVVKTRNGLLPRLDLFATLGRTGYASSFGDAAADLDGDRYEAEAGLVLEYPTGNREARARHRRSSLSREQAAEALANLEDLVCEDVQGAYIAVAQAAEQIAATAATRELQEINLRTAVAKFRSGRQTSLAVAQVQRDLVSSEIAEVEAAIRRLQALVALYRADGSLLARRGIEAPGGRRVGGGE